MTDLKAIVDYSRPVGWWCAFCEEDGPCFREQTCISMGCKKIPVYLPIPEGQRPPSASEVDDAEVVTFSIPGTSDPAWCAPPGWTTFKDTAEDIYEIVVGVKSFITGATE